jgi:hypothetical protein
MEAFEERVKKYVDEYKPVLYVLTPCYGSMCFVSYINSLLSTMKLCNKFGIEFFIEFCRNDSLVQRARNNLIARAMKNPKTTHMMFIDADIIWDPHDILKLLISHQPLVGGLYPLKNFYFDRLKDPSIIERWKQARKSQPFLENISDENLIQHNLLRYNFNQLKNNTCLNVVSNLTEVRHLATGFMMIRRETIECMQKAFPSTKYVDDIGFLDKEEEKHAYALFDCGVEEGHYFSEDWLFSQRWTNMGGKIYVNVTVNLTHTGIQDFKGSFLSHIVGGT